MSNKVSKLLLGSVMTLSGVAGAVGTSSLIHNDPVVVQAAEQTAGPSVTIQGKYISLPTTIYIVKKVVNNRCTVAGSCSISGTTYTEIGTLDLTDESSLSVLSNYKYKQLYQTYYDDEENWEDSDYTAVTTYENLLFLVKNGTTYTEQIPTPSNSSYYEYTYDAVLPALSVAENSIV